MTRRKKWLATSLALIVCVCAMMAYVPTAHATLVDSWYLYEAELNLSIDGLTFSYEQSDPTKDVSWEQLDAHSICGAQWADGGDGNTDTLVITAARTGRLGIVFTNKFYDYSVPTSDPYPNIYECDLSQIRFTGPDNEEVPYVDYSTVSQLTGYTIPGDGTYYITGAVLHEGESFRVTLVNDSANSGSITMPVVYFDDPTEYSVTLNPAVGGSYTYETDGIPHTVTQQTTVTYNNIDGIRLTATPAEGYNFAYWEDGAENTSGSTAVEYTDAVPGSALTPHFLLSNYQPNFMVGNVSKDTWSEAFQYAASHNRDTVVALRYGGEYTLPADAEPDGTYVVQDGSSIKYVVPAGMKLLVPYNGAETGTFHELMETSEDDTTIEGGTGQSYFARLTIPEGVTLEVAGALNVNAQQYKAGQQNGQVAGQYGQIVVNGRLNILNNAFFYCYGYATGSGTVTANNGATVNELLQVRDWPGGTNAFYWFTRFATKKLLAEPDGGSFIFNQYYAQNIECQFEIISGATCKMNYSLYLSQGSAKITICAAPELVGPNGLFNLTSGYVIRHYDASADRMIYDIYGEIETGNVSLSLERYIGEGSMDSADFILGINNHLTLNVKEGSYLTLGSSYQLLPEFQINVDYGGTLEVADGTTLYLWDVDDWNNGDYAFGSDAWDMVYSPSNPNLTGQSRQMTSSTTINVNGELIMYNNVYTTANGGTDIGKAIQSSEGTGVIHNEEGHTIPNLRVISGRTYGPYNGPYDAEESYTYYPIIPCDVVVGHFYEQDDLNAYAPIWTGDYRYLITTEGEGEQEHVVREGWYNRSVTVYDLEDYQADPDNAVGVIYPVGGYTFTLDMDNTGQTVFEDYQVITNNAEVDEDASFILANRDGSEKYYGSLTFNISNEDVVIAVSKKHFDYLFAWYEQTIDMSVRNTWFDVVVGEPTALTTSSAAPYSAEQLQAMSSAVASSNPTQSQMLLLYNKSYGADSFADLEWAVGLMQGTNDLDYARMQPIMTQAANADAVTSDGSHITATLNSTYSSKPYVLVPLLTNYASTNIVWKEIYPDGHTVVVDGDTYAVATDAHYIIDGTPVVHGNSRVFVDEDRSTLKTVQLASDVSRTVNDEPVYNIIEGDLIVDVKLKAYDYEINFEVNNTSATDSTKNLSLNNVTWQGYYSSALSFDKIYVADGVNAVTGEAIVLTYEDLVGYSDNWRINSNSYKSVDGSVGSDTTPAKFAFGDVSTAGGHLTATVTNELTGSSLALTNITGDETVTVNMYGYHFVADRTVTDENGNTTHDLIYAMIGTKLGDTFDVGLAVTDVVFTKLDGSELIPYITPDDYSTLENLQFTLIANVFQDCILSYELTNYDHMIRYGYAGNVGAAASQQTYPLLVKQDDEIEIAVPTEHGRVRFTDYVLYSLDGNTPINSANGVATIDTSDPEVIRISGITQDFRIIGIETQYDKKVVWKEANEILQTDYLTGSSASTTLTAADHKVFTSAIRSYLHVDGATVSLTSTADPVRTLVLDTTGTGYDVTVRVTTADYDYEVYVDGGVLSRTYYVSSGGTVSISRGSLSANNKTYVITGISGVDGLTVSGPANGNSQVAWGWPNATISGFTADTNITLTLKEYYNSVLWNIDGFSPAPGSGYAIQKWSYVAEGEDAVLSVPAPYVVTGAEKGSGEELITNLSRTDNSVTASISGDGSASVRVSATRVDHTVTWVVDGESSTVYASDEDEAVYLNLTGRKIVSTATVQSGNTTQVAWEGPDVILTQLDGDPVVTVTTTPYEYRLSVHAYTTDDDIASYGYVLTGDSYSGSYSDAVGRVIAGAEISNGSITFTDNGYTVTGLTGDATVDLYVRAENELLTTAKFDFRADNSVISASNVTITDRLAGDFQIHDTPAACVVLLKQGSTYQRLRCTAVNGEDNTYAFSTGSEITPSTQIVVALKGDLDGDGTLTAVEGTWVYQFITGSRPATGIQRYVADLDGDGTLTAVEGTWVYQAITGSRTLAWDIQS